MVGYFRSAAWDPPLIFSQMISVQCLFYVGFGICLAVLDFVVGRQKSLDQLFRYENLQFKEWSEPIVISSSYLISSFLGALGLLHLVQRSKLCLDFTCTAHLYHLIACWIYNGAFPSTLTWWLVNVISIVLMTVLGEFLCVRVEMKAIPLGPKVDL